MKAQGAIGLWGRIHVADCPYCHAQHYHDDVEPGDTVTAGCRMGEYVLDVSDYARDFQNNPYSRAAIEARRAGDE
jgi:hypothetical protein